MKETYAPQHTAVNSADPSGPRVVAAEIMVSTEAIKEYITDPERTHEITDYLAKNRDVYGTQSFDQHLSELYKAGAVTLDVAKAAASNPSDFERALAFE